jgi:D-alanine-D-alanine ligase
MSSLRPFEPVAVLYQAGPPPLLGGAQKPMKPGGYSDSGADIAYALRNRGFRVLTPIRTPRASCDTEWVFPDSLDGIGAALDAGARCLWLNTVLHREHCVEAIVSGTDHVRLVGQRPDVADQFDDKWRAGQFLRTFRLSVANGFLFKFHRNAPPTAHRLSVMFDEMGLRFPVIIKPVRGRGSVGVERVANFSDFDAYFATAHDGTKVIIEELLADREITVTVMPPGTYRVESERRIEDDYWALPPVERFNHIAEIAPYNGAVAVTKNSRLFSVDTLEQTDVNRMLNECCIAARVLGARAPIRIDCRRTSPRSPFKMIDVNLKPNMTGPGRPNRDEQNSLSAIAANAIGWEYPDLVENILINAWPAHELRVPPPAEGLNLPVSLSIPALAAHENDRCGK